MYHPTTLRRIAAPCQRLLSCLTASCLLLVAACGGGGGGDAGGSAASGTPTTASPSAPTTPVTPTTSITIYPAVRAVPIPALTADRATNAFNWTNYRRAQLGLSPLVRDAALDKAAAAHVAYLIANNSYLSEGHGETAGKPGFTGATHSARIVAAGFVGNQTSENMSFASTTQGTDATEGLVEAPYHRQAQLGNFASGGAAMASSAGGYYVIDFGGNASTFGPSTTQVVVYPASGETAAPIDWLANEIPNPVPDLSGQRVGFPISLGSTGALTIASFGLKDDKGVTVTTRLVTTRSDNAGSLFNYAFIVPLAPLASGTKYTATVSGSTAATPFDLNWSFTTAPAKTLTATASAAALAATAGSTVDITLAGGTGRYLEASVSIGYSYTVNPGQLDVLSVENVSTGMWRLTRGATACAGVIFNCSAQIIGSDSAGTSVTLNVPIR